MAPVPSAVGKTAASAGRSTPGSAPNTILAVAIAAPVLPALTKPLATPSRTRRTPTRMLESRLERTACAALSSIVITSLAWTISMGSPEVQRYRLNSALSCCSGPTRITRVPEWRAAWIAPSISGLGARSEPIASRAMTLGMGEARKLACFLDLYHFATFVIATLGAGAMGHLLLVAIGTLGKRVLRQGIVRPPGGGSSLRVAPFRIRHGKFLTKARRSE